MIRKIAKLLTGVLAVLIGLMLLRGTRRQPRHLVGGLLIVSSATLLVSDLGAVTNTVWLLPTLLALWGGERTAARTAGRTAPEARLPRRGDGLPPRISVEQ